MPSVPSGVSPPPTRSPRLTTAPCSSKVGTLECAGWAAAEGTWELDHAAGAYRSQQQQWLHGRQIMTGGSVRQMGSDFGGVFAVGGCGLLSVCVVGFLGPGQRCSDRTLDLPLFLVVCAIVRAAIVRPHTIRPCVGLRCLLAAHRHPRRRCPLLVAVNAHPHAPVVVEKAPRLRLVHCKTQ